MPAKNKKITKIDKQNLINGIHAARLRDIKPFISFDYDLNKPLTKHAKSKIKKYHDEIRLLTAKPFQPYKPKSRDRLKAAQQYAGHETNLPGLKVAFIPRPTEDRVKIRFNKAGKISVKSKYVKTEPIYFDIDELENDVENHVNELIAESDADSFSIMAGKYEILNGYDRDTVAEEVAKLASRYSNEDGNMTSTGKFKKGNYFGEWMHGLYAHKFDNQEDEDSYWREKRAVNTKEKRQRRNKRARDARANKKLRNAIIKVTRK